MTRKVCGEAKKGPTRCEGDRRNDVLRAAGPPLLFGLRLWASVCLALYVAFWLELDNAYWAGTSAAIESSYANHVEPVRDRTQRQWR
jgi:hypothetical protein